MSDYALFVNSLFLCLSCSELVVGKLQFKARKQAIVSEVSEVCKRFIALNYTLGVSTLGLDNQ